MIYFDLDFYDSNGKLLDSPVVSPVKNFKKGETVAFIGFSSKDIAT